MYGIPNATRRQVRRSVLLSLLAALALGLHGAENVHIALADSPGKAAQAEPALPTVPVGRAVVANSTAPLAAVGSGFTYQGSLKSGGNPANGQYDFQFTLYD